MGAARRATRAGPPRRRGDDALLRRGARHGALRQLRHRVPRRGVPRRHVHVGRVRRGQPRRGGVHRARSVRHHVAPRRPAAADVRFRHPLLPGRGAGPRRTAGGTAAARPAHAEPAPRRPRSRGSPTASASSARPTCRSRSPPVTEAATRRPTSRPACRTHTSGEDAPRHGDRQPSPAGSRPNRDVHRQSSDTTRRVHRRPHHSDSSLPPTSRHRLR